LNQHTLRNYVSSDTQAVVDVINANSQKSLGYPCAVVDGVGNLRMARYVALSSEKVVAVNAQDEIVGYAYVADKENGIVTEVGGAVHPEHWGNGVGQLLIRWAEERADNLSDNAPSGVRTVLQANLFESEKEAVKLFVSSGYSKVREWVHMVLEMESAFAISSPPDGMLIREMDLENDWEIVGPAMDDAFADHWGAIPQSVFGDTTREENDEKETNEDEIPTDDSFSNSPGYCFIMLDGDRVAGGILCNAKLVERTDTGRVGSVFVRREYRRKGIGSALMRTAFNTFWQNGLKRIILDTDAASFSESTKFYGGLGMKPYRREFLYEKEIRPGMEVRSLDL
jgi:GNAT superfamily N-acetyltransferase